MLTPAEVIAIVDGALVGITPTLPLELADTEAVRCLLVAKIPERSGYSVDVYHDHRALYVTVRRAPYTDKFNHRRVLRAVPA